MAGFLSNTLRGAQSPSRKRFPRFYPSRVMHWVAIGICLIVLPLSIAVVSATFYMRELAKDSQAAVLEGTQSVRYSRALSDNLHSMERNARVYQVIGDTKLLANYRELHAEFEELAARLLTSETDAEMLTQIGRLLATEAELSAIIIKEPPNSTLAVNSLQNFNEMREIVRALIDRNSEGINHRVQELHEYATEARSVLMWESLMVVPVAAGLGMLIMYRVTRPMRELDRSIHRLGSGDTSEPISVGGPQDIRELGHRLEWLRQRLGELADQKRTFLQHISHELKTPLASIREGTNLLNGRVVGELNDRQSEIVDILENSSMQLQRRIEDLLAFSISDEPRAELNLESRRIDKLVRNVLSNHELCLQSKHIELDLNLTDIKARVDVEKFTAVIDNLLSNAVKYSPEHGVIMIRESVLNKRLQIDVIDSGPGIHPSEAEHVFQPFYQSSTPYSGHLKGTGLGLAIARLYVRMHQGDLNVLECRVGAHLRVTLPLQIDQENGAETLCTQESA